MWPNFDPLTRTILWLAGKIYVAPVINLCGVCVGTDKVGHFFQQGFEYSRLAQRMRERLEGMSPEAQRRFYEPITGPPPPSPFGFELEGSEFFPGGFELSPGAYVELGASALAMQYGNWLEGFEHNLSEEDIRWIRRQDFIPF
jgi:hypothetical protein